MDMSQETEMSTNEQNSSKAQRVKHKSRGYELIHMLYMISSSFLIYYML